MTAFEPSGDAHAAPVIEALRRLRPDWPIDCFGGPLMKAAGANQIVSSVENAAMGFGALKKINWLRDMIRRMRAWHPDNPATVHLCVDSPAANGPVARVTKEQGAHILHLVAPQHWAWGPWRSNKLARLTEGLLCLLPFEPEFFRPKGIPARFIGHPRLNRPLDRNAIESGQATLATGHPRIVILPGSRPAELTKNGGDLLDVVAAVKAAHPDAVFACAAFDDDVKKRVEAAAAERGLAGVIDVRTDHLDPILDWADLAVAVSGTVSLDLTRHATPMVGIFRVTRFGARLAPKILTSPYRLLPNIIEQKRIVPEFVPFAGSNQPIIDTVLDLLAHPEKIDEQKSGLRALLARYEPCRPDETAANAVIDVAEGRPFPAENV